jgi:hypothetical protein
MIAVLEELTATIAGWDFATALTLERWQGCVLSFVATCDEGIYSCCAGGNDDNDCCGNPSVNEMSRVRTLIWR